MIVPRGIPASFNDAVNIQKLFNEFNYTSYGFLISDKNTKINKKNVLDYTS